MSSVFKGYFVNTRNEGVLSLVVLEKKEVPV